MREYILTTKEREAIKQYLQDKKSNDYIHLIRHRAKVSLSALKEDLNLLNLLFEN
ncbi:TPA: hypothetical protein HA273_05985 [Candidatus Bathyarchaeota archaeon]|nr:hypothetical protein [Candidatus Bathyarchaeota archaeon]